MSSNPAEASGTAGAVNAHAVFIHDVTVAYRKYTSRPETVKQVAAQLLGGQNPFRYATFDAIAGLSLEVAPGETIGIVGSNGAGKSSLLRVITGVLPPTSGKIVVTGTVESIIDLGAGFDRQLSAIENIRLYGALLGWSRDYIGGCTTTILDYAGLGEFQDTPIRHLSSGMVARLGFAVAVNADPDILVIDDVIAVGDERFKEKCLNTVQAFAASGKTVIIVSHALGMLSKLCDRVAVMSHGKLVYEGEATDAVAYYTGAEYAALDR